ncbi:MAG: hypothetical protein Q8862_01585 [Bacteroidota bacterium]|nr:hypothetical protein [Bacteroidota bacterium]
MTKLILTIILLFFMVSNAYPKEAKKILYIFPDDVEIKLSKYIENTNKQHEFVVYLMLSKSSDERYKLYIAFYKKKHIKNVIYWVKSTNRYVVVNQEKYPLLIDYDYDFSTSNPLNIGDYGGREGQVLRAMPFYDGYNIEFNKYGIIKDK